MRVFPRSFRAFKQTALALGAASSVSCLPGSVNRPTRADDRARPIHILLIRHGESTGNVAFERMDERLKDLQKNDYKHFLEELRKLIPDPDVPLSPLGEDQVERLRGYAPLLMQRVGQGGRVCVFVSPFLRTCQTAAPLVAELRASNACRAWVKDDIYEVSGMFRVVDGPDPIVRTCRGQCGLSAKQIRERFDYDTELMVHAEDSGWCSGVWESDSEGRERASKVSEWLRSDEFYEFCKVHVQSGTVPIAVLVSHGWFLNCLLKSLLGIAADPALDKPDRNEPEKQANYFIHQNTGVSRIVIVGDAPRRVYVMGLDQLDHLWSTPQFLPGSPPPRMSAQLHSDEKLHTKPGA